MINKSTQLLKTVEQNYNIIYLFFLQFSKFGYTFFKGVFFKGVNKIDL